MYIYSKTEQLQKTSRAAQAASKACLVCFAVFERCIRYLTRNTYIMVAIEGKPFWTSAYRSFKLLQNNSIRFAAAQGLSSFLLFVAKLGITSFCMLACFLLIEHMPRYGIGGEFEVLSPFLPCFVTFCSALVVAMSFMSIYEIGIDTLLISFCLDEQKFKAGDYDVMVEKGIRPSAKMYAEVSDACHLPRPSLTAGATAKRPSGASPSLTHTRHTCATRGLGVRRRHRAPVSPRTDRSATRRSSLPSRSVTRWRRRKRCRSAWTTRRRSSPRTKRSRSRRRKGPERAWTVPAVPAPFRWHASFFLTVYPALRNHLSSVGAPPPIAHVVTSRHPATPRASGH